jgi:endonuclease YncB( thermonuclease family)
MQLVKQGFAKALDKKSPGKAYEEIKAASDDCEKRKVGLWNTDPKHIANNLREVTYFGESSYSATKLLDQANQEPKPLAAILEHVFGTSYVSLYVYRLKSVIKMQMAHLYSPNAQSEPALAEEGKKFVSKMLLHRTVGVKLARVDDRGDLVGRIFFPAGDIAAEVLKSGLAKLSMPKDMNFDAEYFKELKQA